MEVTRRVRVACAVHLARWWGLAAGRDPPCPCKTPVQTWLSAPSTVDLLDWNSLIDSRTKLSKLLLIPNMQVGTHLCHPWSGPTGRVLSVWVSPSLSPVLVPCCCSKVRVLQGLVLLCGLPPPCRCLPTRASLLRVCLLWAGLAAGRQGATSCSCFRLGSWSLCSHASLRRRICR